MSNSTQAVKLKLITMPVFKGIALKMAKLWSSDNNNAFRSTSRVLILYFIALWRKLFNWPHLWLGPGLRLVLRWISALGGRSLYLPGWKDSYEYCISLKKKAPTRRNLSLISSLEYNWEVKKKRNTKKKGEKIYRDSQSSQRDTPR